MSEENQQKVSDTEHENLSNKDQTNPQLVSKRVNDELSYNARIISSLSEEFVKQLNDAKDHIRAILTEMQEAISAQGKVAEKINSESGILCLIPDKIQGRIDSIVPRIASEIDLIYNSNLKDANQEIETLQNKLTSALGDYQQKLDEIANKCTAQLGTTTENFAVTIEQKLNQFSDKLTKSAGIVSTQNSKILFKTLAFVVVFSAVVSGVTSYVVTTKFPRSVTITGANNLSVTNSRVDVWNNKKDLYIKERLNVRK